MDAVEMLKEINRMTKNCQIGCGICEFKERCADMRRDNPEKYVEIVENWSKAHQQKTQADLLFERYPNARKRSNGLPYCEPCAIGLVPRGKCDENKSCEDCRKKYWSAPVEE